MLAARDQTESPQPCQTDDGIDEATHPCRIAFEKPSDKIKLKKAPKTPIERPNNNEKKRQYI
jgi:hypothetical protein